MAELQMTELTVPMVRGYIVGECDDWLAAIAKLYDIESFPKTAWLLAEPCELHPEAKRLRIFGLIPTGQVVRTSRINGTVLLDTTDWSAGVMWAIDWIVSAESWRRISEEAKRRIGERFDGLRLGGIQ